MVPPRLSEASALADLGRKWLPFAWIARLKQDKQKNLPKMFKLTALTCSRECCRRKKRRPGTCSWRLSCWSRGWTMNTRTRGSRYLPRNTGELVEMPRRPYRRTGRWSSPLKYPTSRNLKLTNWWLIAWKPSRRKSLFIVKLSLSPIHICRVNSERASRG